MPPQRWPRPCSKRCGPTTPSTSETPPSGHHLGDQPAEAVRSARSTLAAFLGCLDTEIVFTSCGTESDNLAIRGIAEANREKRHIITTAVEHSAVLNPIKRLESQGYRVTYLPVDRAGRLDVGLLGESISDQTALISVMFANNETGATHPIERIGEVARNRRVPLHVDAVQGMGKVPFRIDQIGADLVSISAHKFHGPERRGSAGGEEGDTLDANFSRRKPGARAPSRDLKTWRASSPWRRPCDYAQEHIGRYQTDVRRMRDRLESEIKQAVPDVFINAEACERLPNTSNIGLSGPRRPGTPCAPGRDRHLRVGRLGVPLRRLRAIPCAGGDGAYPRRGVVVYTFLTEHDDHGRRHQLLRSRDSPNRPPPPPQFHFRLIRDSRKAASLRLAHLAGICPFEGIDPGRGHSVLTEPSIQQPAFPDRQVIPTAGGRAPVTLRETNSPPSQAP
jgi:cysteine sulfinate desulfinase/cysteine desulfurase-like protein